MADDEWDAEGFEPAAPISRVPDKWDGEDEEDVKDAWDAEDEEKPAEAKTESADSSMKATQRKKKKPLAKLAEKEARLAAELKEKEEGSKTPMTKEERENEAERQKKMQEEADLKLAKEAFGVDSRGVDSMFPVTEEEFTKFKEAVAHKVTSFKESKHYSKFLEGLIQDLVVDAETEDAKKISVTVASVYHEKAKLQKEVEKKQKKKKKGVIKAERDNNFGDLAAATGDYNDLYEEDFI